MKKIFNMLMASAIAAFTFTACEDVPEPYTNPYDKITPEEVITIDPSGSGTIDDPYNVAAALKLISELGSDVNSDKIYVKGVISDLGKGIDAAYMNAQFTIADDKNGTNSLLVYRSNYLNDEKFTSTDQIKEGDEVIMYGPVVNYKGTTPEFTTGTYIYSHNGTASDGGNGNTGDGNGKGTADSPYDVNAAIAAGSGTGVYVKGFIVGNITGQVLAEGAHFDTTGDSQSNILVAASADETDVTKCMPVQLPTGNVRTALNLKDNPGNYKKEVTLYGNIEKYFGATGIKSVTYAILEGNEIGTKPNGGNDTPSVDNIKTVTIAEFNAAAESTDVWYKLTGTISNLKDGDQYGNFDLTDATGSVYVYGVLSEKGGAKKLFQELVTKYGLANGSTITIIGNRGSYTNKNTGETKIEVLNAYIVVDGNGGNDTPNTETGADGSTIISVADFNAAAESTDVWYQLTGTISNLKDGDQYGNFDLTDATGSVYVYGVLSEKGGAKKKFQELVEAKGIANGKKITIVGNRGSYNNKIEVMNAYFISVE